MLLNQGSVTTSNTVEPSSSPMPKMVPDAAASMVQASHNSKGYKKELNRGENIEQAIIDYGYLNDETISQAFKGVLLLLWIFKCTLLLYKGAISFHQIPMTSKFSHF